jgi:hypothetical protein
VGFFERPDPRLAQSADPTLIAALGHALRRQCVAFAVCALVLLCAYSANVAEGVHDAATIRGRLTAHGIRDREGVWRSGLALHAASLALQLRMARSAAA